MFFFSPHSSRPHPQLALRWSRSPVMRCGAPYSVCAPDRTQPSAGRRGGGEILTDGAVLPFPVPAPSLWRRGGGKEVTDGAPSFGRQPSAPGLHMLEFICLIPCLSHTLTPNKTISSKSDPDLFFGEPADLGVNRSERLRRGEQLGSSARCTRAYLPKEAIKSCCY